MNLTSSVFEHNGKIPALYTCDGQDMNPPLFISDVPAKTKSLVLIMDDPDAVKPTGKVWDHWLVWNIPSSLREIKEGEEPKGVFGLGSSRHLGYKGPCPPDGEHRYYFKLYALDKKLELPEGSGKVDIERAMDGHIIEQAELIGLYIRKNSF